MKQTQTFIYGEHQVVIETGEIARQADSAVLVTMGGTTVMVTAVIKKEVAQGQDFFPLTVEYQEKSYAAGKIPGGFFKREGRPSEGEILIARLIDRPLRPLFPEGFFNEMQVIASVLSFDREVNPDIVAMIGASAAVKLSGAPFDGPIGAARVGYIDGKFLLNPSDKLLRKSQLDLVVAGTKDAVLMVESEAAELSEELMLEAVFFGHQQQQVVIDAINSLAEKVAKAPLDWQNLSKDQDLVKVITDNYYADLVDIYQIADKKSRYQALDNLHLKAKETLLDEEKDWNDKKIQQYLHDLQAQVVRERILADQPRIDGRDRHTVRPIAIRTNVLPRVHGSALFTRGETQALVVTTLGTGKDAQLLDGLSGEFRDNFMLHYNFPPFSVGEVGRIGSPKRREIGHGRLARRAMSAVLPDEAKFPYVIRVVSEITESNGSSSMASVCGASLSLMDAGVPIKAPVAGVAMGLIKEGERFAVLTDILGDEDHLGDMDFKVAGTAKGVTALQMDIKITGINHPIMQEALQSAQRARLHILGEMNKEISIHREQLSEFAPRFSQLKIDPDKIKDVIGKGGATIRLISEQSGATIEIADDGNIKIAAIEKSSADLARKMIEDVVSEPQIGQVYFGKVSKITDFGAFVTFLPNKEGLVHISQISRERVSDVRSVLTEGQEVKVKLLEIDRQGRVRLSIKEALE